MLRDRLVAAIIDGSKTATSSTFVEYSVEDEALPVVGTRQSVVGDAMRAYLGEPDFTVDDDTLVVLERFRLV